jgi:hypothetical protein
MNAHDFILGEKKARLKRAFLFLKRRPAFNFPHCINQMVNFIMRVIKRK